MSIRLKRLAFRIARGTGLFCLSRCVTRRGLRILCYHGFSFGDTERFMPMTFMRAETFRRRIEWLVRKRYPVLPLHEAVERLSDGTLPRCAVVLTFDDGAYSTWRLGVPVLREHNLPATIYVTTYYSVKQTPVFRIAIQYMFWKTRAPQVDVSGLGLPSGGVRTLPNASVAWEIIDYAESNLDDAARCKLAAELGGRLGVPYDEIARSRAFSIMNADEIREAAQAGIDIQLHAHRHRLPEDADSVRREIRDNRAVLEPLVGRPLRHFCYPSGVWSSKQHAPLRDEGVLSATTCDGGLNCRDTPPLALRRFLDGEQVSDIEFEAELCGFAELLRRLFRRQG